MTALSLFNTRTRKKEPFVPLEEGHARVYSCGPTVYSPQHLGNMRPCVFADLLRRALLAEGLRVTHVMNITDVGHLTQDDVDQGEDKMEKAARESGRSAQEIAAQYTEQWQRDLRRLNVLDYDVLCKATDHIAEQIEMIQKLEERGCVYTIEDGVYFDVSRFARYADLARLDLESQEGGARIGEVEGKRNPQDFALWKFSPPDEKRLQSWDSPWGEGFPGWHIECSAMSVKYLGETFDIHTGGVEHLPVHHTNEVAQAEMALGVHPWVNVWMHEDWILFEGGKMSKSLGNVKCLDDLVADGVPPLAYRFFLLQAHYRKQQHYNAEAIEAARTGYQRMLQAAVAVRDAEGEPDEAAVAPWLERFRAAVRDDLNAPRALAIALEALRSESLGKADRRDLLTHFDAWLGLGLLTEALPEATQETDPRIDALVEQRQEARRRRDFAEADRIRDELAAEGITIEDTPEGPRWKRG
ncbi:MAG: cysteine--tRNA ligase [Myxococcota bacterium]|nr:cysteine--tRNA ligase [Myxococcota bacterium]